MTISQILFEYQEAKEEMKRAAEAVSKKAVEKGLNPKVAEDTRVAHAYLVGLTRREK